ncbi:MAG: response regulator [Tepidisphaeraceae bacterium]
MANAVCKPSIQSPVVLVVDDEPDMIELFRDLIGAGIACDMRVAATMADARRMMQAHPIDLLIADVCLPDGSGMDLLEELRLTNPDAGAMFMTAQPRVDHSVFALRHGVLDYLPKPFSAQQAKDQVKAALRRQRQSRLKERRLGRLKHVLREMNKSRRMVSKKVDLLCNDLIGAYGEVASQMQTARTQESFRRCIEQAIDLEQLLCHAMDWLLKEAGYSNIAVWLSDDESKFELGAYMKYTLVGSQNVTSLLRDTLVQSTVREGFLHLSADELNHMLTPAEQKILPNQTAISTSCSYLGESLAVVTLFRDGKTPFRDEDTSMLREIATVFATQLATLVKKGQGAPDEGSSPSAEESDLPWADEEPKKKSKKSKRDAADWWKTGEAPPF